VHGRISPTTPAHGNRSMAARTCMLAGAPRARSKTDLALLRRRYGPRVAAYQYALCQRARLVSARSRIRKFFHLQQGGDQRCGGGAQPNFSFCDEVTEMLPLERSEF
jgi:hypothetical protein